ncbi:MAG: hypothetical protein IPH28_24570 [Cytophagaceae bacterium]|nr:hypothetical protein [Cytophagaceae bacterium]
MAEIVLFAISIVASTTGLSAAKLNLVMSLAELLVIELLPLLLPLFPLFGVSIGSSFSQEMRKD